MKLNDSLVKYVESLTLQKISEEDLKSICSNLDSIVRHRLMEYKLKDLALSFSNYNSILKTLSEFSLIDKNRILDCDWEDNQVATCSNRVKYEIKNDFVKCLEKGDIDGAIGYLNELLGNCCISDINDL